MRPDHQRRQQHQDAFEDELPASPAVGYGYDADDLLGMTMSLIDLNTIHTRRRRIDRY
jgi:hypothetical protein